MIALTDSPIDVNQLVAAVQRPEAGAIVLFLGVTRQMTDGRETRRLRYEAYHDMALRELTALTETARHRWPLAACAVVHRTGDAPPGTTSVAVAVSSPHRDDAFAAGKWLIDELKRRVPIWKQEEWADGQVEWIHP